MSQFLVIRFNTIIVTAASDVEWFLFDPMSQLINQGCCAIESINQQLNQNLETIIHVIVPCDALLLSQVSIPSSNPRQIKQALPYVVEELIAEEIENVHMALPAERSNQIGLIDVAVIKHKYLINWLDILHHHGLSPHHIVPDVLCVPWQDGDHTILLEGDSCLLRLGKNLGVACETNNVESIYTAFVQQADQEPSPTTLNIVHANHENSVTAVIFPDQPQLYYKESSSEVLAATLLRDVDSTLNLLQGGYQQEDRESLPWLLWKKTLIVFGLSLMVFVASQSIIGTYFYNKSDQLYAQSVALYQSFYPNERRVFSPRRQLETHLKNQSSSSMASFLPLLAKLSIEVKSDSKQGNFIIKQLRFDNEDGKLQLEIEAKSIEQLETMKQKLSSAGLKVAIGSANVQSEVVVANMIVELL